jgi:hypothetical protein
MMNSDTTFDLSENYYIYKEIEFDNYVSEHLFTYILPIKHNLFPVITKQDFTNSFTNSININKKSIKNTINKKSIIKKYINKKSIKNTINKKSINKKILVY